MLTMGEDMVSHTRGTRTRAAKVCGAGLARETGKGTALDADPCEGLEEPAGEAVPGAACGPTLEELGRRVGEVEQEIDSVKERSLRRWGYVLDASGDAWDKANRAWSLAAASATAAAVSMVCVALYALLG